MTDSELQENEADFDDIYDEIWTPEKEEEYKKREERVKKFMTAIPDWYPLNDDGDRLIFEEAARCWLANDESLVVAIRLLTDFQMKPVWLALHDTIIERPAHQRLGINKVHDVSIIYWYAINFPLSLSRNVIRSDSEKKRNTEKAIKLCDELATIMQRIFPSDDNSRTGYRNGSSRMLYSLLKSFFDYHISEYREPASPRIWDKEYAAQWEIKQNWAQATGAHRNEAGYMLPNIEEVIYRLKIYLSAMNDSAAFPAIEGQPKKLKDKKALITFLGNALCARIDGSYTKKHYEHIATIINVRFDLEEPISGESIRKNYAAYKSAQSKKRNEYKALEDKISRAEDWSWFLSWNHPPANN